MQAVHTSPETGIRQSLNTLVKSHSLALDGETIGGGSTVHHCIYTHAMQTSCGVLRPFVAYLGSMFH